MSKQKVLLILGKLAEVGTQKELSVKSITNGLHSAFILTDDGKVYAIGRNNYSACGFEESKAFFKTPTLLDPVHFNNEKIADVKSQNVHALFLTESGTVYACGANWNYPCGFSGIQYVAPPKQMPVIGMQGTPRAKKIATGIYHSLILLENNKLYGCGSATHGELLDAEKSNVEPPMDLRIERYTNDARISDIQGTNYASYVLTEEGKLFLFGKVNASGSYGDINKIPTVVDLALPVRQFRALYQSCVIQCSDRRWHVFGQLNGIVPLSPLSDYIPAAAPIHNTAEIESVSGFYTPMLLTKQGKIMYLHYTERSDEEYTKGAIQVCEHVRELNYEKTKPEECRQMRITKMAAGSDAMLLLYEYPTTKLPKMHVLQREAKLVDVIVTFA